MNKKIIILITGLLTSCYVSGQIKHEFSVYGGGGLSTLLYTPAAGKHNNGFGGLGGLGYTIFFNDYFGIGTGAEIALYNAKVKSASFYSENSAVDISGDSFLHKSQIDGFEEKQKAFSVNIPLMFNFQTDGYHRFYGALGAKIGIPLTADYKSSAGKITTSGYYGYENLEYTAPDFEFIGFGTFSDEAGKGDVKFNTAYMVSAEVGMKWNLGGNTALYTGIYADYGLNDIAKREAKGVAVYNAKNPNDIGFNSILASQYTKSNGKPENFTDKVSPLAVGIKIKLAFGKGINKERDEDETDETKKKRKEKSVAPQDSIDTDKLAKDSIDAEREAYLNDAAERRKNYKQAFKGVGNYGLSVVTLNAEQKKNLNTYVEQMKKEPDMKINVTGHTCDVGTDKINMQIGQERADVAKDYMVEEGIAPSRIKTFTMGKNKPLVPNISDVNRKKNRRLEIEIVK